MVTDNITRDLASFIVNTHYQDIPDEAINEVKLLLMDSIGCALAAITTDKGKMTVALAKRLGGPSESSIIGLKDKLSCSSAVLANGELIGTIDYDATMSGGHSPPYVIPAPLAVAEFSNASGKDTLLAMALGFEVSARVASAVQQSHGVGGLTGDREKSFSWGTRWGQAYSNFGAAGAAGRLLNLDQPKMENALGLAGHLCQVLTHERYTMSQTRPMTKYGAPGWQNTGAIDAVLLADMGYLGDTTVFDPNEGFWKFVGYEEWHPDIMMADLGKKWIFPRVNYKFYPCCGMLHGALDCFYQIIDQHHIMPEEIDSIVAYCHPTVAYPCFINPEVINIPDAQFNPRYVLAVAAYRVKTGVEWQDPDMMRDRKILEFGKKITCIPHPEFGKIGPEGLPLSLNKVEIVARGQTFTEESTGPRGSRLDAKLKKKLLTEKFRHNAERSLTQNKIDKAIDAFLNLEKLDDISEMMENVSIL